MNKNYDFESVRKTFRDQSIYKASNDELEKSVCGLANDLIKNDYIRHQAIIMTETIHSILLRRLLDEQEKRNHKSQFFFMILAGAGVLGAVVQIVLAVFL